jgi:hypothetical protein
MNKLPRFNGAADMREAIRRTANELANAEANDLSPYQQGKLITGFIGRQPKGTYRITHVNETRWIAFVAGKTKKPTNFEMLRAAWDWMREEHHQALDNEYKTFHHEDRETSVSLFNRLFGLKIFREHDVDGDRRPWADGEPFGLWYVLGSKEDRKMACCSITFGTGATGIAFTLRAPMFNKLGEMVEEYIFGPVIDTGKNALLLLGISADSKQPILGMLSHISTLPNMTHGTLLFSENPRRGISRNFVIGKLTDNLGRVTDKPKVEIVKIDDIPEGSPLIYMAYAIFNKDTKY